MCIGMYRCVCMLCVCVLVYRQLLCLFERTKRFMNQLWTLDIPYGRPYPDQTRPLTASHLGCQTRRLDFVE